MTETKKLLKEMIGAAGLSGFEGPIRKIVENAWDPLVDEVHTSRAGSLHGLKRGTGDDPRPSILIATHMDAIGMIVSRIEDGFIYFTEIGGIDPRVLPGQLVTVHGREDLPAVVAQPPAFLLPKSQSSGTVPMESLLIDTGLPAEKVKELVRIGDPVSFAQEPLELGENILGGHSLDNRASVAALTHCLSELTHREHYWDVWAVATSQEEETMLGAGTSAFELRPDLGIAVDVTFAAGPGASGYETFKLGEGPTIGWGPNNHPGLYKAVNKAAKRLEMNVHREVLPRHSGTDAYMMQVAAEGIPTQVISIPLRYMHTPVEMIDLRDVTRVGRLLAEFIAGLSADFMDQLAWNKEKETE